MIVRRAKYFFKFNIIKDIRNADNFLLQRPLLLRPNECSGKSTKKKKKQDKKQNTAVVSDYSPLRPCSHLCVPTRSCTRSIRESHRGYIPECILLYSACTRIIRKTPPIMIIRTLHRDPDVCPWHVRSGGSSYVIGKRAVSFLPFVIVRVQRCR